MPDSRPSRPIALPLSDDTESRPREHDHPPATGSPYPYPSRLTRLNRALRSTANLLSEMEENAASSSDREAASSTASRRRRFSLIESEDLPPQLQYASEFPLPTGSMARQRGRGVSWGDGTAPVFLSGRETDQRPAKRRRYEAPNPVSLARPPITYGHYGQVEPGCLRMEIISCDGGEMVDHRSPQVYLGYQNVLKSDKSVYCSSQSHVSMVLRHADTTSFFIDKLHIVAPENGFDAPVTDGVVLVAMELEHLKKYQDRPSRPQIADKNTTHDARFWRLQRLRSRCPAGELSLTEALRDPEIAAFYHEYSIAPGSTDDPLHSSFDFTTGESASAEHETLWNTRGEDGTPQLPNNAATIHIYDEDLAQSDTSSQEVIDYRNHRQHTRSRQRAGLFNGGPYHPMMAPSSQRWPPDQDDDDDPSSPPTQISQGSQTDTQEQPETSSAATTATTVDSTHSVSGGGDEHQVPPWNDPKVHFIPFKIDKGKSRIAIKFEPEVSARFVLLKLAAGSNRSNVDVQNIVVSGFAGPRFFPAKQAR